MRIKCLFWLLMITLALPLAAQTESGVFAPFVSRLSAQIDGRFINLSWSDSQDIRGPVYLFRSDEPFLGPNPVLGPVLTVVPYGVQSFYEEIRIDGIYYYFAVATDLYERRFVFPIPDTNTIAVGMGVEIPRGIQSEAAALLQPRIAPISMLPRAFARDLQAFQYTGDDHALSTMIRNNFSARDWEAVTNELLVFLSVPRSPDSRDRARFYLGQCLYFLHQPREALFEFLTIMDRFPIEITGWVQASYSMINYYYGE